MKSLLISAFVAVVVIFCINEESSAGICRDSKEVGHKLLIRDRIAPVATIRSNVCKRVSRRHSRRCS